MMNAQAHICDLQSFHSLADVDLSSISSDPNYQPSSKRSGTSSGLSWFSKTFSSAGKKKETSPNKHHHHHHQQNGSGGIENGGSHHNAGVSSSAATSSSATKSSSSSFAFWKKRSTPATTTAATDSSLATHQSSSADNLRSSSPAVHSHSSSGSVLYRPENEEPPNYEPSANLNRPPVLSATAAPTTSGHTQSDSSAAPKMRHHTSFSAEDQNGVYRDRSASVERASYYTSTYYSSALSGIAGFQPSSARDREKERENHSASASPSKTSTPGLPEDSPSSSHHHHHHSSDLPRSASAQPLAIDSSAPIHTTSASSSPAQAHSLPSSSSFTSSAASSSSSSAASSSTSHSQSLKLSNFRRLLSEDTCDMDALRKASWNGIPPLARSISWKILLGYLPSNLSRRETTLRKRREEYRSYVEMYYEAPITPTNEHDDDTTSTTAAPSSYSSTAPRYGTHGPRSESENDILRQIRQDVPRTAPGIPFFKQLRTQKSLERMLYIFAMRHTASGYVQGMNDLSTPFYCVFLSEYLYPNAISSSTSSSSSDTFSVRPGSSFTSACHYPPETDPAKQCTDVLSDPYSSAIQLSSEAYLDLESDVYGCLSAMMDRILDNYTFAQPGVQRMVYHMRELVQRIDAPLDAHFERHTLQYIHFAFRWMTCLLMREMPIWCIVRIWDTYLAEDNAATSGSDQLSSSMSSSIKSAANGGMNGMTNGSVYSGPASSPHSSSTGASPTSTATASLVSTAPPPTGFRAFHIYLCTAFLLRFSSELQRLSFQDLVLFLQKLPTERWGVKEVETLLAQAYVYKSWFHASPHQLK